jgi:nucleotide-binding universal stress UspA family protein
VGIEWRQLDGQADRAVVAHARHADLTIVGQRSDDASEDSNRLLEALIMESGRPVLAVPAYGKVERFGHHVLCAWNGTREAARAVADALPLLCQAEKVTILSIDPDQSAARLPGADIALHLARHGVAAEASTTFSGGLGVGDALLARASDLGADLIVMGAYGHSRAREAVFGGATRSLLDTMTVPVLMSH